MGLLDRFCKRLTRVGAGEDPAVFDDLISQASLQLEKRDFAAAVATYQAAAERKPDIAELRHTIGSLLGQLGRVDDARAHLEAAIELDPMLVPAHLDLALVHRSQGRMGEAVAACERILKSAPEEVSIRRALAHLYAGLNEHTKANEHLGFVLELGAGGPEEHYLAGNLAAAAGDLEGAVDAYGLALSGNPALPEVHHNLGIVINRLGRLDDALAAHRRAVEHGPSFADAHYSAGVLELGAGRAEQALQDFDRALAAMPAFLAAQRFRALALARLGDTDAALAALGLTVADDPELAEVHFDRGNILRDAGRDAQAEASYRAAIAADDEYAEAFVNLGLILASSGRYEEAARTLTHALGLDSSLTEAHNNLGGVLQSQARLAEAIDSYQRALALDPNNLTARSNLLAGRNYAQFMEPGETLVEHRAWSEAYRRTTAFEPYEKYRNKREPNRPLRLGYLSPDFRTHSVAFFLQPILRGHDRDKVELVAFSNVTRGDETTQRMRKMFTRWHDISTLDDAAAASCIYEEAVDVLIDLAGHTEGGRPGVLARAPAPVQMTYLGYPNTTGLAPVKYRITDAIVDPPGRTEAFHSETLVRVPSCFLSYAPPETCPRVSKDFSGPIAFASFNELLKLTPSMLRIWSQILRAVPDATLTLKGGGRWATVVRSSVSSSDSTVRELTPHASGCSAEPRVYYPT